MAEDEQESGGGAAVGDHVEHGPEVGALLEVARRHAVDGVGDEADGVAHEANLPTGEPEEHRLIPGEGAVVRQQRHHHTGVPDEVRDVKQHVIGRGGHGESGRPHGRAKRAERKKV